MPDTTENIQMAYLLAGLALVVLLIIVVVVRTRGKRVLGIDVGNAQIKVVELSGGAKPVLRNYAVVPTPPGTVKDGQVLDTPLLARTLSDIIKSHGFVARRVSTALTGQNLLLRMVELPAMPKKEIANAVKWQFDQFFQIPSEDAVSDYQIISGEMGGPLSLMLVAMQKAPVITMINTLKQAGLKPLVVDIEPLAVLRTIRFGCDDTIMQGTTVVFDFGAGTTNVSIFKGGILRIARVIPFGGKIFTRTIMDGLDTGYEQAEKLKKEHGLSLNSPIADLVLPARDELFVELSRTVNYYLADNRQESIGPVFLLGGGSLLKDLQPQLRSYLQEYINSLAESFDVTFCRPLAGLEVSLPKGKSFSAVAEVGPDKTATLAVAPEKEPEPEPEPAIQPEPVWQPQTPPEPAKQEEFEFIPRSERRKQKETKKETKNVPLLSKPAPIVPAVTPVKPAKPQLARPAPEAHLEDSALGITLGVALGMAIGEVKRNED